MFRVLRLVLCFAALSGFRSVAMAAGGAAQLSLYLFQSGQPQANIELRVDGDQALKSTVTGSIVTTLQAGKHHFVLKKNAQPLHDFELEIREGEIIQAIITLFDDGRVARVDLESSMADTSTSRTEPPAELADNLSAGALQGVITSSENGQPVAAARVLISGISDEVITDSQGHYQVDVPQGVYTVSVLINGFNTLTREQVKIKSGQATGLDMALSPSGMELPEFVVLEPFVAGSLASVLDEQKSSDAIASVLGADQIARSGDSNAASALRRATGLTVVDGKFVYVRGLGERFSSTLLNGARIPSPDPTRRVIAMDLFPASIIDSVLVQKSYSPNMPGEFSGGVVEIRTRTIPDDFFARLSISTAYNEGTTFARGLRYQGGDDDWLGIDDGSRDMPASLAAAAASGVKITPQNRFNPQGFPQTEIDQFGTDLSNVWDVDRETLPPDGKAIFSIGDVFQSGDFSFGYTGSARWDQGWDTREEERRSVSASGLADNIKLNVQTDHDLVTTKRQVQTNLYLSTEVNYAEQHRLYATGLLVRQAEDETRVSEGTEANFSDDQLVRRVSLEWEETQLLVQQYGGEHTFSQLNDLGFDWLYTTSKAKRKSPYERRYRFDQNRTGNFVFSTFADSNRVAFSELTDTDETIRFDLDLPVQPLEAVQMHLKSGYYRREKDRASDIRRFQFGTGSTRPAETHDIENLSLEAVLSDDNINAGVYTLTDVTTGTDNYTAEQTLQAYYGQIDLDIFDFLKLTGGVRVEENKQSVVTFNLFDPSISTTSTLESTDLLPAVAMTLQLSDKQQLRASYSETLSRPDFRELSPAFYRDPLTDEFIQGRDDLQQSTINNYDLRWEYYLSDQESVSAAFFWKDIQSPIEKVGLAGAGAPRQLQNTDSAIVYGVEVEAFKNLDFLHHYLENFYVAANYTWTESNTRLTEQNKAVLTTNNRPLQGHSPYIFNVQFGYDNEASGTNATLLYNTYGKRIAELGQNKAPDTYEQPFHQLDFVLRQQLWDGLKLTFKAKNLLDDTFEMTQGNVTTRKFRKNRAFSLGINWDF